MLLIEFMYYRVLRKMSFEGPSPLPLLMAAMLEFIVDYPMKIQIFCGLLG
jgi:hypothetical protein